MACLFQSSIHIYLLLHLVGIVDASGSQMRLVVRTWSWATLPELFLVRTFYASGSQNLELFMRLVVRTWSWATLPELFLVRIFLGRLFPQSYAQI